jgi:hypothetical protein
VSYDRRQRPNDESNPADRSGGGGGVLQTASHRAPFALRVGAADDFRPDSDVDVLVEFLPGHVPGLRFVTIEREFSELLHGRRVGLATPKFLNPRIRERVLSTAEPLYVAA